MSASTLFETSNCKSFFENNLRFPKYQDIYYFTLSTIGMRASPDAAIKLCLGDLLVMGSNPETAFLHMQG
ncbi:hypothetical protein HKD37_08G021996 [Glycine soja]